MGDTQWHGFMYFIQPIVGFFFTVFVAVELIYVGCECGKLVGPQLP